MADALVDLGDVRRALGEESKAKQCFREALQTAIETQTDHTALQALVEIAAMEASEGNTELALEMVLRCLQHGSTRPEVTDRAESLRAELVAQLTPPRIEAAEKQARTKTLEDLAQKTLAEAHETKTNNS